MSYLIAAASSDGEQIDRHFGHSEVFSIINVEADGKYTIQERRAVHSPCRDGSHDQNAMFEVIKALIDCRYVLAEAIGNGAAAQLNKYGITSLETDDDIPSAVEQVMIYDKRIHKNKKR